MKTDGSDVAGKVLVEGDYATLVFSRLFNYPPEEVWNALTEPEELAKWYMTKASIDGKVDGKIDFISGPSRLHVTGKILVWDPPKVLEHEWKVEPRDELPGGENTVVRWELEEVPNGTLLKLEHRNLSEQTARGFAPGTHAFLDRLEAQLDKKELPGWFDRYNQVAHNYPKSWFTGGDSGDR